MTFAELLKSARKSRVPKVSQQALATAALELDPAGSKFSQARVWEWETGPMLPDLRQLTLLCRALNVSASEDADLRLAWEREQLRGLPVVDVPADLASAVEGVADGESLGSLG
jgi:transcriptional regulator with XRE-family HTH domain